MESECKGFAISRSEGVSSLLHSLHQEGYRLLGPTIRDGAIVYDAIEESAELPFGYRDRQRPGSRVVDMLSGEQLPRIC